MRKLLIEKVKKIVAYIVLGIFGTAILGVLSFGTGIGITMGESGFIETFLVGLGFWVGMCFVAGSIVWALYETGILD